MGFGVLPLFALVAHLKLDGQLRVEIAGRGVRLLLGDPQHGRTYGIDRGGAQPACQQARTSSRQHRSTTESPVTRDKFARDTHRGVLSCPLSLAHRTCFSALFSPDRRAAWPDLMAPPTCATSEPLTRPVARPPFYSQADPLSAKPSTAPNHG